MQKIAIFLYSLIIICSLYYTCIHNSSDKLCRLVVEIVAKIVKIMNICTKIYFQYSYFFRSSTSNSWISAKGMHTSFTLFQAGDLGNIKSVFFQLVKSVECKTATKKSTSKEKLSKISNKNRTNLRRKLDVICSTSNNFHIKSLNVIKYVKNNLPIFGVDWLPLRHQVEKGARGKEEFWQLNGLASKFNSS